MSNRDKKYIEKQTNKAAKLLFKAFNRGQLKNHITAKFVYLGEFYKLELKRVFPDVLEVDTPCKLVIYQKDLNKENTTVIGIADTVTIAESMINEHFGSYKVISHRDIRDSSLEYSKVLKVEAHNGTSYLVEIWLEWFTVNSLD